MASNVPSNRPPIKEYRLAVPRSQVLHAVEWFLMDYEHSSARMAQGIAPPNAKTKAFLEYYRPIYPLVKAWAGRMRNHMAEAGFACLEPRTAEWRGLWPDPFWFDLKGDNNAGPTKTWLIEKAADDQKIFEDEGSEWTGDFARRAKESRSMMKQAAKRIVQEQAAMEPAEKTPEGLESEAAKAEEEKMVLEELQKLKKADDEAAESPAVAKEPASSQPVAEAIPKQTMPVEQDRVRLEIPSTEAAQIQLRLKAMEAERAAKCLATATGTALSRPAAKIKQGMPYVGKTIQPQLLGLPIKPQPSKPLDEARREAREKQEQAGKAYASTAKKPCASSGAVQSRSHQSQRVSFAAVDESQQKAQREGPGDQVATVSELEKEYQAAVERFEAVRARLNEDERFSTEVNNEWRAAVDALRAVRTRQCQAQSKAQQHDQEVRLSNGVAMEGQAQPQPREVQDKALRERVDEEQAARALASPVNMPQTVATPTKPDAMTNMVRMQPLQNKASGTAAAAAAAIDKSKAQVPLSSEPQALYNPLAATLRGQDVFAIQYKAYEEQVLKSPIPAWISVRSASTSADKVQGAVSSMPVGEQKVTEVTPSEPSTQGKEVEEMKVEEKKVEEKGVEEMEVALETTPVQDAVTDMAQDEEDDDLEIISMDAESSDMDGEAQEKRGGWLSWMLWFQ